MDTKLIETLNNVTVNFSYRQQRKNISVIELIVLP